MYKLRRAARERSGGDSDIAAPDDEATEMEAVFARSRHMYRRANQLAPELGRPHNQLANLAQMQVLCELFEPKAQTLFRVATLTPGITTRAPALLRIRSMRQSTRSWS